MERSKREERPESLRTVNINAIAMTSTGKIAAGFVTGTLLGGLLALLLAPKTGPETRAQIGDQMKSLADSMDEARHKVREQLGLTQKGSAV